MSKFHESLREILEEMHYFLHVTLHQELLSTNAIASKEELLLKLQSLNQLYPQLQLVLSNSKVGGGVAPKHESLPSSPTGPPPPYIDMQGSPGVKDGTETRNIEESYEPCSSEKSCEIESQCHSESGSNQSELCLPPMPATNVNKFEKCGFLEKKGKERLGGLIKSTQQRWYAINGGVMYCYEKPTDKVQKGAIILPGYEVRPVQGKDKKSSFSFELVCPGRRTYQFAALSPKDMKQWLSAIERNTKGNANAALSSISVNRNDEYRTQLCESDDIYEMVDEKEESEVTSSDFQCVQNVAEMKEERHCISDADSTTNSIDYQDLYISLWDCQSEDSTELDFCRGDVIHILSKEYDSYAWWIGELHGKVGFVPKSYLMEAYQTF